MKTIAIFLALCLLVIAGMAGLLISDNIKAAKTNERKIQQEAAHQRILDKMDQELISRRLDNQRKETEREKIREKDRERNEKLAALAPEGRVPSTGRTTSTRVPTSPRIQKAPSPSGGASAQSQVKPENTSQAVVLQAMENIDGESLNIEMDVVPLRNTRKGPKPFPPNGKPDFRLNNWKQTQVTLKVIHLPSGKAPKYGRVNLHA